jgi:hypothetical protein
LFRDSEFSPHPLALGVIQRQGVTTASTNERR